MATPLSPICQKIQTQINSLKQEQKSLQAELQEASPGQKPALVNQIKALGKQLTAKNKELQECVKKHPYVPPPPAKPKPCTAEEQQVAKLASALNKEVRDAVKDLQEDLKTASPGQKPAIIAEIKKISADIRKNSATAKKLAAARKAFFKCLDDHGLLHPLSATFKGTATLKTSNSNAKGPFNQSVTIGLRFSARDHKNISITSFPKISVTYDTGSIVGKVTTTVTMTSGSGTFNKSTNKITLDLSLFFHHSTDLAGDSTLDIDLKTDSALDADGKITVSGSSKFKDGYLDGATCWLTVKGTISPRPGK